MKNIMIEVRIDCYLCGNHEAKQGEGHILPLSYLVECKKCGKYDLTFNARELYFLKTDGTKLEILCKEQKEKLSEYVRSNYVPDKMKGVPITVEIVEKITGKKSSGTRFK